MVVLGKKERYNLSTKLGLWEKLKCVHTSSRQWSVLFFLQMLTTQQWKLSQTSGFLTFEYSSILEKTFSSSSDKTKTFLKIFCFSPFDQIWFCRNDRKLSTLSTKRYFLVSHNFVLFSCFFHTLKTFYTLFKEVSFEHLSTLTHLNSDENIFCQLDDLWTVYFSNVFSKLSKKGAFDNLLLSSVISTGFS